MGPLRAIELHNTCYASSGEARDGLAEPESAAAWLEALDDRLPFGGEGLPPTTEELIALRRIVRVVLHLTIRKRIPMRASIDILNRVVARAPHSTAARWRRNRPPLPDVQFHGAQRADIVLSAIAADAIDLITGPARHQLSACGAP